MLNLNNNKYIFQFQEFDLNENNEAGENSEDNNNNNNIKSYLKEYNNKIDVEIE
ncbi:hypothetical protein Glove_429g32 [Diversispora epigaea]|uniref:Uncharacterized protein n=1 Tax=Diversispora epigaea TaxID=1348612 RepID=A0A397GT11_9GLOM|nr:hypothetical protein Glove_429g32 [Diversispora epigaea]